MAATRAGTTGTTPAPSVGVLRCVTEDNDRLFGYLNILSLGGTRGYIPLFAANFFGAVLASS
jgi:hypothetical protein